MKTLWRIEANISDGPKSIPEKAVAYLVEIDQDKVAQTFNLPTEKTVHNKGIDIARSFGGREFEGRTLTWKDTLPVAGEPYTWDPMFQETGVRIWKDVVVNVVRQQNA